jgi:hypothetical protein
MSAPSFSPRPWRRMLPTMRLLLEVNFLEVRHQDKHLGRDFLQHCLLKNRRDCWRGKPVKMPSIERYQEVLAVAMIIAAWLLLILFIASLVFG